MNRTVLMRFAVKLFSLEWRSGQLLLLFLALVLATTLVSGLMAFSSRVEQMLMGQSRGFLAGDQVLRSSHPLSESFSEKAQALQLQLARVVQFRSMLYVGEEHMLVNVRAADEHYPLIGTLGSRLPEEKQVHSTQHGPGPGTIWLDDRIVRKLSLKSGARVELGDATFELTRILVSEPDAGAVAFSFSPKVLMHLDDLPKTNVLGPASRADYDYFIKGKKDAITQLTAWMQPQMTEHMAFRTLDESQPAVAGALKRARHFLQLATGIVVLLACFALAMTGMRFSRSQIKTVAVLKTLGVKSREVALVYALLLFILLLLAFLVGAALGFLLQDVLTSQVAGRLGLTPELPDSHIWGVTALVAFLGVAGFAFPAFLQLGLLPAVTIFARDRTAHLPVNSWSIPAACTSLTLMLWLINDRLLTGLLIVAGVGFMLAAVALPVRKLLNTFLLKFSANKPSGLLIVAGVMRHLPVNSLIISVFACCLMLVVTLIGVKGNLFESWQNQLPEHTPNYFVVNIQKAELPEVLDWLKQFGKVRTSSDTADKSSLQAGEVVVYPMVRGRLLSINDALIKTSVSKEDRSRAGVNREINLSFSRELPADNRVLKGHWFDRLQVSDTPFVSVESKLAERLGIRIGDKLTFSIGAQRLAARVGSLRLVDWDRMQPNFFMLFAEDTLSPFHATYMTSFYLPPDQQEAVDELMSAIPTLVLADVNAVIKQLRRIIDQVSIVLWVILLFVLLASLLVLIASVQSTLPEREKENAIVRALGGSRQLIVKSLMTEFALLGLLAGILASAGSELLLLAVQVFLMDMPPAIHPGLWWIAPLAGVVMIAGAGYLSARKVVRVSPDILLRNLS